MGFWLASGELLVGFWSAFGRLLMGLWWTLVGEKSASIIKKHKLNDKNEIKKSKRESTKIEIKIIINKNLNHKKY